MSFSTPCVHDVVSVEAECHTVGGDEGQFCVLTLTFDQFGRISNKAETARVQIYADVGMFFKFRVLEKSINSIFGVTQKETA